TAIKIAGVDKNTANPFGGEIMRDKTGEPNGMFLDKAEAIIARRIPSRGGDESEQAILLGCKRSVGLGWCEIQNAGSSFSEVALLKKFYGEGKIRLRIYEALAGPGGEAQPVFRDTAL